MMKIALYGKGGIGKSTTAAYIASAFAQQGLTILQVGCDSKADSTMLVMGRRILIVADQVLACSIRRQVETRFGCPNVAVASFFGLDEQLRHAGDVALSSERTACGY